MDYIENDELIEGIDKNYFEESDSAQNEVKTEILIKSSTNKELNSQQKIQIIAPQNNDNNLQESIKSENNSLPPSIVNNEEKSGKNEVDKSFLSQKRFRNFQDNNNSIEVKRNDKLNNSDFQNIKEKKSKTINKQLLKEDNPYKMSGNINNNYSNSSINLFKTDYNDNPNRSNNKKHDEYFKDNSRPKIVRKCLKNLDNRIKLMIKKEIKIDIKEPHIPDKIAGNATLLEQYVSNSIEYIYCNYTRLTNPTSIKKNKDNIENLLKNADKERMNELKNLFERNLAEIISCYISDTNKTENIFGKDSEMKNFNTFQKDFPLYGAYQKKGIMDLINRTIPKRRKRK